MVLQVEIHLTETETITMLDIAGTCVALDANEAEAVKKGNAQYEVVSKAQLRSPLFLSLNYDSNYS